MSFISLYKAISISGAFFLDAGIAVVGWFFFYFFLPETKGRSLEEMEKLFEKKEKRVGKVEALVENVTPINLKTGQQT
ncbi:hypothetical protein IEQ34_020979 [Dendrobium chrysotoxum]|uniref:Major facilitator superfamily (MFS) profile domain-containing protein n=1 Tax=Dendrobium chrysotoxum TaxID=161865 RepID=A0AAV7G489_DENCH|nr:hypothetical protein IEQ34_020979 [Dendrobium chrysotoxum]